MRNLTKSNSNLVVNNHSTNQIFPPISKRINCQISQPLLIKCQNLITSRQLAHDYTYSSLSDLIRKSLIAYKEKNLNLNTPRPTGQTKKTVGIVLPIEL